MKKVIGLLVISVVLFGCNKKLPASFDYGEIKEGVYDNTFFKFKIPVNPEWYVLNNEEANNLYKIGNEVASGDNEALKKTLDANQINVAKLFTAFRDEPGTNQSFNPSLLISAENLKNVFHVKTNSDYLKEAKKMFAQTEMQIKYLEEKEEVKIGSQDFSFVKLENTMGGQAITQDYYITIKNGFALLIIMSYVSEEGESEVYKMFNKLKI